MRLAGCIFGDDYPRRIAKARHGFRELWVKSLEEMRAAAGVERIRERRSLNEVGGHDQFGFVTSVNEFSHRSLNRRIDLNSENFSIWSSLLRHYGKVKDLRDGKRLHSLISSYGYDQNTFLGNCLIDMYGNCGKVEDARAVFENLLKPNVYSWNILIKSYAQNGSLLDACSLFDRMPLRDVVSWNAMIAAFTQNGHCKEALDFFQQMQRQGFKPVKITFVCAVDACASLASLEAGQEIHAIILDKGCEGDLEIGNALINMYGKCGSLSDASTVFHRMAHKDVVSWNAMIAAFAQNGSLDDARHVFNEMPHRNVVSWNSMLSTFIQYGNDKEALDLFHEMQLSSIKPDKVTFVCALDACASLSALEAGHDIHTAIIDIGYEPYVVVGTALVNMYGKCASLCDARSVFCRMCHRDAISWNAIIAAYAQNGQDEKALDLFPQMLLEGIKPNETTLICVLTACSHTGQVDTGRQLFYSMNKEHGVFPTGDHYVCMVDILGRAGHLDEAENLINSMSSEKVDLAWLCLLCACRIHCDVERGLRAANRCLELDLKNAAPYVMLSNIYAAAGRWSDVAIVREILKESGIKKQTGHACIEVNKMMHEFLTRVELHSQMMEIHAEL